MANNTERPNKKETTTPKITTQMPEDKSLTAINNPASKNNLFFSGLTFIMALAAIGLTMSNLYFNQKLNKKLTHENTNLLAQIQQLKISQNSSHEQIDSKAQSIQQSQNELETKLNAVNKQLKTAMNHRFYQNQDWLLLKARYYLELSQINAQWSDNFNAAVALSEQADVLLNQVSAPKILAIRQAIAKDIVLLKSTSTVDVAGLLSKLDAAQIGISNLTIQSTIDDTNSTQTNVENTHTSNPIAWRSRFQDSLNLLEKLVVVRRNDENVKPLISPLFKSILRESIRLNLQEAQWAILNNNPVVYQLALKQAILNLKRTFDESTPKAHALLEELKQLQHIKLTQEKPDIGSALPLLNQMIENKELMNQTTNDSTGDN